VQYSYVSLIGNLLASLCISKSAEDGPQGNGRRNHVSEHFLHNW